MYKHLKFFKVLEMPFGNIIAYDVDPEGHMLAKDDTHIDSQPPNA